MEDLATDTGGKPRPGAGQNRPVAATKKPGKVAADSGAQAFRGTLLFFY